MSDTIVNENLITEIDEKQLLLDNLAKMGITAKGSCSVETLRKKYKEVIEGTVPDEEEDNDNDDDNEEEEVVKNNTKSSKEYSPKEAKKTKAEILSAYKQDVRAKALALKRVIVTCNDPKKAEYDGDAFFVGNAVFGNVGYYVPFGVEHHVPNVILDNLKQRVFQKIQKRKVGKVDVVDPSAGKSIPEFTIVELPPLTKEELDELAQRQLVTGAIDRD